MRIILVIFCCLLSYAVIAQDVTWRNYTIRDGLPHSSVYRIFQDKKGFLWFSTDYGMCSFDGRSFRSDFNDRNGQLNTSILSISEKEDGSKFICTVVDLLVFTDTSIRRYPTDSVKGPRAVFYAGELKGNTWAIAHYPGTTTPQVFQIGKLVSRYHDIRNEQGKPVEFNTLVACNDELLFSSTNGVYSVRDTTIVRLFRELVTGTVVDVARDKQKRYWAGLRDRIVVIEQDRKAMEIALPAGELVNDIFLDRDDDLWIATEGGGLLKVVNGEAQNIPGLSSIGPIIINDIFQDFEGNIWLATYGSGLYMLNSMKILDHTSGENISSIYSRVLSVVNDKVWISTIGKIYMLDQGKIHPVPVKLLQSDYYTYFVKQVKDRVFIGSAFGVFVKDIEPPSKEKKIMPAAISICYDSRQRIWLGGYKKVYQMLGDSLVEHEVNKLIGGKRIIKIEEDNKGDIWLGTGYGVYMFSPDGKHPPVHILAKLKIVQDMCEDGQKRMWIASTNGLACVEDGKYRLFTKEHGLASNHVTNLLRVGNVLWVGTSSGLNFVDLHTMQVKNLTPIIFKDVILSLCSKGDDLYIGTANSVYSINVNSSERNDTPPPVFITHVHTAGKELNWPQNVELPYKESGLSISFIGISYEASHLIEYRYRIKGLDDNWSYTTNNLIEIPSLPSGNYTFILNARKNNGKWTKDVVLNIFVATPFWKTWWFLFVVAIVLAIGLFFLTRWQTLRIEASKRKNLVVYNKMAYLKQQALSALINPHFIFNCMNSIQHFLNSNDNEAANEYMADFAQLIRMTLEDAQQTFLPLEKEISRIRLYLSLEQLRFGDKLQYEINIDERIDLTNVKIPNMILQPYIENAIWHGIMPKEDGGIINVQFSLRHDGQLKIVVEDDGVGILTDPLTTALGKRGHYGIKLTRERLQLLKELSGQYYNISIIGSGSAQNTQRGTRVEIVVPTSPKEDVLGKIEEDMNL